MFVTWKWIRLVLFLTSSALLIHVFVIDNVRVKSDSMLPTLWPGDYVLAYKLARQPRLGDIVLLNLPDSRELITKRVVGLEGDTISIHRGALIRNGETATYLAGEKIHFPADGDIRWESWANSTRSPVRLTSRLKEFGPIKVPPGHFFVLGDNRPDSVDSRVWGSLPLAAMRGRLLWVLFSVDPSGNLRQRRSGLPL